MLRKQLAGKLQPLTFYFTVSTYYYITDEKQDHTLKTQKLFLQRYGYIVTVSALFSVRPKLNTTHCYSMNLSHCSRCTRTLDKPYFIAQLKNFFPTENQFQNIIFLSKVKKIIYKSVFIELLTYLFICLWVCVCTQVQLAPPHMCRSEDNSLFLPCRFQRHQSRSISFT